MKPELIEGPQAIKNFETAMKTAFRVSKAELDEAERKRKAVLTGGQRPQWYGPA